MDNQTRDNPLFPPSGTIRTEDGVVRQVTLNKLLEATRMYIPWLSTQQLHILCHAADAESLRRSMLATKRVELCDYVDSHKGG